MRVVKSTGVVLAVLCLVLAAIAVMAQQGLISLAIAPPRPFLIAAAGLFLVSAFCSLLEKKADSKKYNKKTSSGPLGLN